MAYTKQTWACGDEITAEKLNHIEDGIENAGGGTLVVHFTTGSETSESAVVMDKTWQEIYDAFPNVVTYDNGVKASIVYVIDNDGFKVLLADYDTTTYPPTALYTEFNTTSETGYPELIPHD